TAPMAPPSVGVASPMKIVPRTKKIKNKGGIITKVTRSAIRDSQPRPSPLLTRATTHEDNPQSSKITTTCSSMGTSVRVLNHALDSPHATNAENIVRTPKDRNPRPPLGSA